MFPIEEVEPRPADVPIATIFVPPAAFSPAPFPIATLPDPNATPAPRPALEPIETLLVPEVLVPAAFNPIAIALVFAAVKVDVPAKAPLPIAIQSVPCPLSAALLPIAILPAA